jgi:hypothetical protein
MNQPACFIFRCLFALVASWGCAANAQEKPTHPARTWTSVNGNTLDGAFVREEGGKVYIQLQDGKLIGTTREKLSPLDLAWIDGATAPSNTVKTLSFVLATQLEKNKMEEHRKVRRLFIKSYTTLTDNDRGDKTLAFLQRDAMSMYGWTYVSADCYLTKNDKKGKVKEMTFLPQLPVELREAVQMVRDKFMLTMPDPVVVKQVEEDGETYWEVQSPPDYVSRVLLLVDAETQKIRRFDLKFPPPAK